MHVPPVPTRRSSDLPAGTLDKPGEGIVEGAHRELAEEARLKAGRWTTLGSAYLMPGYCDERMTFYLAEDLSPTEGHAELDEDRKSTRLNSSHVAISYARTPCPYTTLFRSPGRDTGQAWRGNCRGRAPRTGGGSAPEGRQVDHVGQRLSDAGLLRRTHDVLSCRGPVAYRRTRGAR